jgi:hypothetical protein
MNDETAQNPYGGTRNDFSLFSGTDSLNPVPSGESGTNRALGVQQGLEQSVANFLSIVRDEALGDGSKNEEIDRDRGHGFEQSARCTR